MARSDFGRVPVPLVVVEGDDGRVFRNGAVGQLLLDQLPVLVLVPRVGRFKASLEMLQHKSQESEVGDLKGQTLLGQVGPTKFDS